MADLHVTVAGVDFSNPLIAASGTFGFGREYNEFYPLSTLGGISRAFGQSSAENCGSPGLYAQCNRSAKSRSRLFY